MKVANSIAGFCFSLFLAIIAHSFATSADVDAASLIKPISAPAQTVTVNILKVGVLQTVGLQEGVSQKATQTALRLTTLETNKLYRLTFVPKLTNKSSAFQPIYPNIHLNGRDADVVLMPWYWQSGINSKHRINGWKDSNLLSKMLALNQA